MRHGPPFLILLPLLAIYTCVKFRQIFLWRWIPSVLITIVTFALMLGWLFIYRSLRMTRQLSSGPWMMILTWVGSILLSLWVMFVLYSLAYDILFVLTFVIRKIFSATPLDHRRREIFLRWAPAGILGASGIMTTIGLIQAVTGPKIKEVTLDVGHQGLAGLKIAQVSDLHVSPLIDKKYVAAVVKMVMSLGADMIVLTGDVADGTPAELKESIEPLRDLKAPLGLYYVTGNHEYYWGVEQWIATMTNLGFEPLINQSKIIKFNNGVFLLGGVTDTSGGQYLDDHISDPHRAMGAHKEISFKLLLAHRPESCVEAQKAGWDVQLSGHTHGGQFFPFSLFMPLSHKYYKGLNRHENLWIYVNQGTGFWGPPQRFAIPSEVTLLKLS